MAADTATITEDAVLGGRLKLRQPKRGHRVGHDAILLAAATGAQAEEHVADLGAGVGAAGLALATRVPGVNITLVEIDEALCALAAENVGLNRFAGRARAVHADVENVAGLAAAGLVSESFDRVLMNPPFNDGSRQNVSPDPRRRLAHVAPPGLLERWAATAAVLLKPQGTLTLIWRADGLAEVRAALNGAFGSLAVMPVLPREGADAIRVLVRAVKAGKGPETAYPALTLNNAESRPTETAEAVLRASEALPLAEGGPRA